MIAIVRNHNGKQVVVAVHSDGQADEVLAAPAYEGLLVVRSSQPFRVRADYTPRDGIAVEVLREAT